MNRVILPAADGVLPDEPVQWWYWTGHLAAGARRFGFEACFFAFNAESLVGQRLRDLLQGRGWLERIAAGVLSHHGFQMVNIALTDVDGNAYDGHTVFAAGMPVVEPNRFTLRAAFPPGRSAAAFGGNGADTLQLDGGGWQLDLSLRSDAAHPPALHYGGRRHDYSFGGFTYYYSRMCQQARGRLAIGGEALDVTGSVWFDRQYGDLNAAVHQGWQWFAIQLDDDTQIMLFDLTGAPVETYGAIVRGSQYTALGPSDFRVDILEYWTSPVSQIRYPGQWRIAVGDRRLIVTPLVADQELREAHPFPTYWEGDCGVALESGTQAGLAYVELQGFTKVTP